MSFQKAFDTIGDERKKILQAISCVFESGEVAPKGAWIEVDKVGSRNFRQARWCSENSTIEASSKRSRTRKYIGRAGSPEHLEAIRMLERRREITRLTKQLEKIEKRIAAKVHYFSPIAETDIEEEIQRVSVITLSRPKQKEFRQTLLKVYENRCAVTGCDVPAALEASHIDPFAKGGSNSISNGLLLRADIHKLFDRYLISVHPRTRKVCLSVLLSSSKYAEFEDKVIYCPRFSEWMPSEVLLWRHYHIFQCQAPILNLTN
ncbi:HNH endonuclease [Leptolyngbya sp. DQ-M1]|uniref:HNH endonuclease n=1 Tax=Leptolyngbya sp. DQ-M1 TaxID=2933920 RepID=UPI003298D45A